MPPEELQPFHETIIEAIRFASSNELVFLASLIKTTKIPANHDNIIKAWNERREEIGLTDDYGVTDSLLKQKQATATKVK